MICYFKLFTAVRAKIVFVQSQFFLELSGSCFAGFPAWITPINGENPLQLAYPCQQQNGTFESAFMTFGTNSVEKELV